MDEEGHREDGDEEEAENEVQSAEGFKKSGRGPGKKLRPIEFAKKYNRRSIVGVMHGDVLKKEMEKLREEGFNHLQAYQPALNRVIEGLSEVQREECRAEVARLNTSVWPKDLQKA